jgi:hypothetical protein
LFKALIIFIPSRRKIEFLQKNITQFNVELIDTNVFAHRPINRSSSSYDCAPDTERKAEYPMCGQEQKKKQETAKEHVEIFLRLIIRFLFFPPLSLGVPVLGAIRLSVRFDFAMTNIL